MSRPAHRIRSLSWQVATGSTAEAFAWRSLLHAQGADLLLPVLEEALDAAVPDDAVVRIRRLHLHLCLDGPESLETELPEAIRRQLHQQLTGLGDRSRYPGETTTEREQRPAGEQNLRTLLQYLHTGSLPWEVAGTAAGQREVLEVACRQLWSQLMNHLRQHRESGPFYFRLLHLVQEEEIGPVAADLGGLFPQEAGRALAQLLILLRTNAFLGAGDSGQSLPIRLHLMASLLAILSGQDPLPPAPELPRTDAVAVPAEVRRQINLFVAALPPEAAALFIRLGLCPKGGGTGPSTGDGDTAGSSFAANNVSREMALPGVAALSPKAAQNQLREDPSVPGGSVRRSDSTGPEQGAAKRTRDMELFPLQIAHAGLVLLHPYLARFFAHCDIVMQDDKALPLSCLPRAAALLHHLATGGEQVAEFELGLIKVLLGRDPRMPVPVCEGLLAEADKAEAQSLLKSAIDHWQILGKTSIQGLRTSFVNRPGLLREADDGWRLHVERRAYDLLLERLPWSLSLVRLPWMSRPLCIEW